MMNKLWKSLSGMNLKLIASAVLSLLVFGILAFIPISEILIQIINYVLVKIVKPKIIPKLDFSIRNSRRRVMYCCYTNYNKQQEKGTRINA